MYLSSLSRCSPLWAEEVSLPLVENRAHPTHYPVPLAGRYREISKQAGDLEHNLGLENMLPAFLPGYQTRNEGQMAGRAALRCPRNYMPKGSCDLSILH